MANTKKRYLIDQRTYEIRVRGGAEMRVRFDRDALAFRLDGERITFSVDHVLAIREVPASNGGRQSLAWCDIDRWFLAPRHTARDTCAWLRRPGVLLALR